MRSKRYPACLGERAAHTHTRARALTVRAMHNVNQFGSHNRFRRAEFVYLLKCESESLLLIFSCCCCCCRRRRCHYFLSTKYYYFFFAFFPQYEMYDNVLFVVIAIAMAAWNMTNLHATNRFSSGIPIMYSTVCVCAARARACSRAINYSMRIHKDWKML